MPAADITTTGFRLTDGRYFITMNKGGEVINVKQILFGCGIHPAPTKEMSKSEWLGLLKKHEAHFIIPYSDSTQSRRKSEKK